MSFTLRVHNSIKIVEILQFSLLPSFVQRFFGLILNLQLSWNFVPSLTKRLGCFADRILWILSRDIEMFISTKQKES
ncbi:hypothetical protein BpHYR1_052817 [Brachionus plicatilis]|uniref:Uncharacterized protein n=1 Tax=Brachionus plicatilis TaxID=10195 RepID=A0A3M7SV38_BRAPC|nr:hypothetical protein BpHYR1_052817 [Brachionus plicatilis]